MNVLYYPIGKFRKTFVSKFLMFKLKLFGISE